MRGGGMWLKWGLHSLIFSTRERRPFQSDGPSRIPTIPETAADSRPLLEAILSDNIVPFWHPRIIDPDAGGYRLHHDARGDWKGTAPKTLVAQSRTLWYFARLVAEGVEPEQHLAAAHRGFHFLRDHMWDPEHGGFFWTVDPQGYQPSISDKRLYGQAFALYGLSQYGAVTHDPVALQLAGRAFDLVTKRLYDAQYGGYFDNASREWSRTPAQDRGLNGEISTRKRMNSHLHLMEALTAYCDITDNPLARERLAELVLVQSSAVVRKTIGACTDWHERDWSPVLEGDAYRVSYGHDVENVTLLMAACQALGIGDGPLLDLYRTLTDGALRYGYDWHRGGFFTSGTAGRRADQRDKVWWVQAEGLSAALAMFIRTGRPEYERCYLQTLAWLTRYQIDWAHGEWYATIRPDGRQMGDKASEWKGPYHTARSVLTCLALLNEL